MKLPKITRLALTALIPTVPAYAQETEDIEIIVTALGAEQAATETGATISVITAEELQRRQTVSVADILESLPGVQTNRSGNVGGQTSVRIRGAEGDQTLVLIDGVRVNDPSTPDGGFDFGNLLAGSIERIEVLRGANSVAWGSQALGGVVNIITRRPSEDWTGNLSLEGGSFGTASGSAAVSGTLGPLGLSLGAGHYRTDGISAFSGGSERDGYRHTQLQSRAVVTLSDAVSAHVSLWYGKSRTENDSVFPPFSSDDPTLSRTQEIYASAGLTAALADGAFVSRFTFSLADINRRIDNPFFVSIPKGRSERWSYAGDWRVNSAIRLVFGAELEDTSYRDQFARDDTQNRSLYSQIVAQPIVDLSLTLGARHDDHRDFGGNTSLSANAAWAISESGLVLRAAFAEGFRAPSLIDLDGSLFGFGTPELRPETAKSYEVGAEKSILDGRVKAAITLFQRDTRDQIAFAACPTPPEPAPQVCRDGLRPFGTTLNIERSRSRGVESSLDFALSKNITFAANYTYLHAENRSPGAVFGNDLPRRAKHSFAIVGDYRADSGWSLGGEVQVNSRAFDDIANSRRLESYILTHVRASVPVTKGVELYGRIENLFDEDYATASDFGTYPRTFALGIRASLR